METYARLKYAPFSAQKGRLIADLIRGVSVERALSILNFNPKRAAKAFKKVLESAIANAEHNFGADVDILRIAKVYVTEGHILKRLSPRARGRGDRIFRRTCHITIYVTDETGE